MRSSVLFTAAFAAAALASPVVDKRGEIVVTDNEVVYVTQVVTVTEGQVAPAETSAPAGYDEPAWRKVWRNKKGRKGRKTGGYGSAPAPAPTNPAPVPSEAPAPAPAPSSYEPVPEPQPTEAPAPAPTSYEEPAPAPTSYEQPAPAPTSSQAAPPPPAYTPPSGGVATTYQQAVIQHHNYHRANHSAPDIKWSESLAATALKIAKTCTYGHNMDMDGGGYGQNIAAGVPAGKISEIISNMFYNGEVEAYGGVYGINPSMANFGAWGHMSAMVWKSTTEVGCATFECGNAATGALKNYGGTFTVCNYNPAGNMQGAFDTEVGACLNQPTIDGSYNVDYAAIAADAKAQFQ